MRICVFGNSVALRIRPPRSKAQDRTYAEWLREDGHDVTVIARAGALMAEAFATIEDDVVSAFPEYVVINHGVVEICLRQTIRSLNNRPITNYYLNSVFARPYVFGTSLARLEGLVWRVINGGMRRLNSALNFRWQWMPVDRFIEVMDRTIALILKETSARIVVVGINPCSPRVEQRLQGSAKAISVANTAMVDLCERFGRRVTFVDPAVAFEGACPEEMVPDGIHLSAEGHRRIARLLSSMMRTEGLFIEAGKAP
jgi:hypothetical protein